MLQAQQDDSGCNDVKNVVKLGLKWPQKEYKLGVE
jgi:hypothetical protein